MNGHHLKLLKELSKDNKLSQRELSRKLGLSLGSLLRVSSLLIAFHSLLLITPSGIKRLFDILHNLSKSVFFNEAYVFGSVVKPHRFSKLSDIDIGFIGLKDEDFFKTMSFISSQIGVEVDIIQLEGHRLADKVMREGVRWT